MLYKLTDMLGNAFSSVSAPFEDRNPSKREVAQMLDAGLSVAAIAAIFDVGIDVIQDLADD